MQFIQSLSRAHAHQICRLGCSFLFFFWFLFSVIFVSKTKNSGLETIGFEYFSRAKCVCFFCICPKWKNGLYNQWHDCVHTESNSVFTLSTDTYGSINGIDACELVALSKCVELQANELMKMVFGCFFFSFHWLCLDSIQSYPSPNCEWRIIFWQSLHAKCSFICIYFQIDFSIFVLNFYYFSLFQRFTKRSHVFNLWEFSNWIWIEATLLSN